MLPSEPFLFFKKLFFVNFRFLPVLFVTGVTGITGDTEDTGVKGITGVREVTGVTEEIPVGFTEDDDWDEMPDVRPLTAIEFIEIWQLEVEAKGWLHELVLAVFLEGDFDSLELEDFCKLCDVEGSGIGLLSIVFSVKLKNKQLHIGSSNNVFF